MTNLAHNIHPINDNDTKPLWDFGTNLNKVEETAPDFILYVNYATSFDDKTMIGMALMLKAIQNLKNPHDVYDFCDKVLSAIFKHTVDFDQAQRKWEERIMCGEPAQDQEVSA